MHDVTRTSAPTVRVHARCYSSVLQDCTSRKTCTPCGVSVVVQDPGIQCRNQPPRSTGPGPSRREVVRSGKAEGSGAAGTPSAMRVTTPPNVAPNAVTVVTDYRRKRHKHMSPITEKADSKITSKSFSPMMERRETTRSDTAMSAGLSVGTVPQLRPRLNSVTRISGCPQWNSLFSQSSGRTE